MARPYREAVFDLKVSNVNVSASFLIEPIVRSTRPRPKISADMFLRFLKN